MREDKKMTGYPSIDKPWLKYYKVKPEDIIYPHQTLYQFIFDNNKDHLDDIIFQYFGKKINYRTFFENVEKVAKSLNVMGIKAGDVVTIMSMHTPETLYVIYGLNYVGATANIVYPTLTDKEILQSVNNTNSKALFVLDKVFGKILSILKVIEVPVVMLPVDISMPWIVRCGFRLKEKGKGIVPNGFMEYRTFLEKGKHIENVVPATDSNAMAVIVYTSGTTGEPKGVCLSNDSINNMAVQDRNGLMDFVRGKTCLFILPPFIGFGITHIHVTMSTGIASILQIVLEPKTVIEQLFRHKPYVFLTGPATAPVFCRHKAQDLSNLKYFIGGGGSITGQQTAEVNGLLARCNSVATYSNGYGMTEASSLLCASANEISKSGSVGIPIIDTNVKIVDVETGNELSYGETGELWFHCPNLMMGYYKNKEATDEIIVNDVDGKKWIRTGDLGTVDQDGFVFITGRLKRIFVTRDMNNNVLKLFPQHIEEVLMGFEETSECGVIVQKDEKRVHVGIAFVTLKDGEKYKEMSERDAILKKIKAHAQTELAEHMMPAEIHIIEKMPITSSGKIDYRALEKMAEKKQYLL